MVPCNGIQVDEIKVEAIRSWPVPTSNIAMRSFHGLTSPCRRFIKDFSSIMALPIECIRKGCLTWSPATQRAPVLALANFEELFELEYDESGVGIGAVLT